MYCANAEQSSKITKSNLKLTQSITTHITIHFVNIIIIRLYKRLNKSMFKNIHTIAIHIIFFQVYFKRSNWHFMIYITTNSILNFDTGISKSSSYPVSTGNA